MVKKKDMHLLQDDKDREERMSKKEQGGQKQGFTTRRYFGQQGQGSFNRPGNARGGFQNTGGYRRPFKTNGAPPHGNRNGGGNFGNKPNKHTDSAEALERWRTLKQLGPDATQLMKNCPLKCAHALAFGSASWCETFKKYEPSMKLDAVKKNNMCRRCLSN